jgi:hypothetical protein
LLLQQENRDALEAKMRNQINLLTTENGQLQEQIQQYSELLNADINPLQLELLLNDLIPKNKQLLLIQVWISADISL